MMIEEEELKKTRDEVLRKIGRNVVNFQNLELILKYLISNSRIDGYLSEIKNKKNQQDLAISRKTMGQLTRTFIDNIYSESKPSDNISDKDIKEIYISYDFTCAGDDSDYFDIRKQALASIVESRNELIHHFQQKFDIASIESCLEAQKYLDQQDEKIFSEYELLKSLANAVKQAKKFFASDEGMKVFEFFIRISLSSTINILCDVTTTSARQDGWTELNIAAQQIHQKASKDLANIKERYGYKSLKEIMLATTLFDIKEEPTKKGCRVVYRLKSLEAIQ